IPVSSLVSNRINEMALQTRFPSLPFLWHRVTLQSVRKGGHDMRTLFTFAIFIFFSSSTVAAQVIPTPSSRKPAIEVTGIYLVTFRSAVPSAQKAAIVQAHGGQLRRAFNASRSASVAVPNANALASLR